MQQNPNQLLARNVPKNKKTYVTRGPNKQTTVILVFLPTRFVFDTPPKSWKQRGHEHPPRLMNRHGLKGRRKGVVVFIFSMFFLLGLFP